MTQKPNFFVVGAVKAGTTSLYHYLSQHPQVFLSPVKEPNYFSTDIDVASFSDSYLRNPLADLDSYFNQKPLQKIHAAFFVRKPHQYELLFNGATTQKAIGEFSTSYLFSSKAALNIYNYNPDAKIIAILRNPVERAFSHYLMALRYSFTTKRFMDAIKEDMKQKEKGWGISELFIELGMYADQIKAYQDIFPASQIKILLHDDLKNNPENLLKDICLFLEIGPHEFIFKEKHNVASVPKYKRLMGIMTDTGVKKKINKFFPDSMKKHVKNLLFTSSHLPKMAQAEKLFLLDIYREDIQKTSQLINRDLSDWLR